MPGRNVKSFERNIRNSRKNLNPSESCSAFRRFHSAFQIIIHLASSFRCQRRLFLLLLATFFLLQGSIVSAQDSLPPSQAPSAEPRCAQCCRCNKLGTKALRQEFVGIEKGNQRYQIAMNKCIRVCKNRQKNKQYRLRPILPTNQCRIFCKRAAVGTKRRVRQFCEEYEYCSRKIIPRPATEPSDSPTAYSPTIEPSDSPTTLPSDTPTAKPCDSPTASSSNRSRELFLDPGFKLVPPPTANFPEGFLQVAHPTGNIFSRSDPSVPCIDSPTASPVLPQGCPKNRLYPPKTFPVEIFEDSDSNDNVKDDLLEISSLAFSDQVDDEGRKYAYVVSDKEQLSIKVLRFEDETDAMRYRDGKGETVAVYTLFESEPRNYNADWEDISLGPCTDQDGIYYSVEQICIYIGDIGNNRSSKKRDVLKIYKFVEPEFDGRNGGPKDREVSFATIEYNYLDDRDFGVSKSSSGDGRYLNAESLFVDWSGIPGDEEENAGDIYVVTKNNCRNSNAGKGGVGKIPVGKHRDIGPGDVLEDDYSERGDPTMAWVADLPNQGSVSCSNGPFRWWTGADMRSDGRLIAMIRATSPSAVYFFERGEDQTVASALQGGGCSYVASSSDGLPNEKQFEAVAFVDGGRGYAELSECEGGNRSCEPNVYMYELVYEDGQPINNEPQTGWTPIIEEKFEDGDSEYFRFGDNARLRDDFDCGDGGRAELNDDKGSESSIYSRSSYDCSDYDLLRVNFHFEFSGYDSLDTLFFEISLDDGDDYFIAESWSYSVAKEGVFLWESDDIELDAEEDSLDNSKCYVGRALLSLDQFRPDSFGDEVKIRFRNSGDGGEDKVSIGHILFEGHERSEELTISRTIGV